jgi:hypothetical protein
LTQNLNADELKKIREFAGVSANAPVPRLKPAEIESAPKERYRAEVSFYMDVERRFYDEMSGYLKNTLGVHSPIIGTADHSSHGQQLSDAYLAVTPGHFGRTRLLGTSGITGAKEYGNGE